MDVQQVLLTVSSNTAHKHGAEQSVLSLDGRTAGSADSVQQHSTQIWSCAKCGVVSVNLMVVHLVTTTGEAVSVGTFYKMYIRVLYGGILSEIQYQ
jgi:hypothetical protein